MVSIRPATSADIPALLAMGHALHAESPRYRKFTFSDAKVTALIDSMVEGTLMTDAPGGVLVAEKDGTIIGMIGGHLISPFFSDEATIATDYTFYVKPEYRRACRAAVLLLQAFEAWAVGQGATEIVPGICTMIDAETTLRFYEKMGYQKYGYALIKGVA